MIRTQRNEPCPCGSLKKYKHCCMQKDDAQAQLAKQNSDVNAVITPNTTMYQFWKRWSAACARNEFGLVHAMILPGGELGQRFQNAEDFFLNLREIGLPYEPNWRLSKVKLIGTHCHYLCQELNDNKNADIVASLMSLELSSEGYRVGNIVKKSFKPEANFELSFDLFGLPSVDHSYNEKMRSGWTRPDLADKSEKLNAVQA